jgi:mono/diheme cytochrome c family protein
MRRPNHLFALTGAVVALTIAGCSSESDHGGEGRASTAPAPAAQAAAEATSTDAAPSQDELAERGRSLYMSNCIACHNPNPSQDGALGPPVTGASYELLEARVIRGIYPPGYTPKRTTKVMIPLPHLENEIDALTAYLSQ